VIKNLQIALLLFFISCGPSAYVTIEPKKAPNWVDGNNKPYQPTSQSNPELDFYDFIKGVSHIKTFYSAYGKDGTITTDLSKMKKYLSIILLVVV